MASHNTRILAGHPEGYLEAFANIYRNAVLAIQAKKEGRTASEAVLDFPGIDEGIRGMAFVENVVVASLSEEKWRRFEV
jgi:hypothetical protein